MTNSFCAPALLKNDNYTFEVLAEIEAKDIAFMNSFNETKTRHILELLSTKSAQFKIIKVASGNTPFLYFLLEILPISLEKIDQKEACFINKVGLKLLNLHKFSIAHPCFSMLYDFDFCFFDPYLVSDNLKIELIGRGIEKASTLLNISIVTIPFARPIANISHILLTQLGYTLPVQDFTMELDLPKIWTSFDDYLISLKKKYHKRAQNIIDKGKNLSYKNLSLDEIKLYNNTIFELYKQVISTQKFVADTAQHNHFVILKEIYKDDFMLEGIFSAEKLIGFNSYFIENQKVLVHYIGFDYSQNELFDIYFNILFRNVKVGINLGKQSINFGRTSLEAKASLGAKPKYHSNYFKTFGLTKILASQVIKQVKSHETNAWKSRQPFKNEVLVLEEA
jgi:hypothetical protein